MKKIRINKNNKRRLFKLGLSMFFVAQAGAMWQGYQEQYGTTILYASDQVVENTTTEQAVETPLPVLEQTGDTSVTTSAEVSPAQEETYDPTEADILVAKYADQYGRTKGEQSRLRGILHCLLTKESVHGENKGHGDNGKAGGPLQFWEDTYNGYRKLMIKEGLVEEVGSRYNLENAIETTTWALVNGRGKAWGPILRGECLNLN